MKGIWRGEMTSYVGTISRSWLQRLKEASRVQYDEVAKIIPNKIESPSGLSSADYERVVATVRPSIPIKDGKPDLSAAEKTDVTKQLAAAQPLLEDLIPSVGRIEATNLPINGGSIGTGWVVTEDLIVTTRHAAEAISRSGSFGEPLDVLFRTDCEVDRKTAEPYKVTQILWSEPDANKADIAFLKIARPSNQSALPIPLASNDAAPGANVVTIGHPIRDSSAFPTLTAFGVDKLNVKRLAPGSVLSDERGWPTHDCNLLGGDSGAAVVDLDTGKAVGLQFYTSEPLRNSFINASTIADYLRRSPWLHKSVSAEPPAIAGQPEISVPIRLRLSIQVDGANAATPLALPGAPADVPPPSGSGAGWGAGAGSGSGAGWGAGAGSPYVPPTSWPPGLGVTDGDDGAGQVGILFATTRKRDVSETAYFTGERNKQITYGSARVRIPEQHRIGRIELPFKLELFSLTFYEQSLDPRKHFIIEAINILSLQEWKSLISSSGLGDSLVFVHGFNVTFRDALCRLAQIAYDIQYPGLPVLFSWPSRGQILDYGYDRESALVTHDPFISMLKTLQSAGINRIHILADSMGNFLVLEALAKSIQDMGKLGISEMMMAAPDLDGDHYMAAAPKLSGAFGMTLYASAADRALLVAKKIAGNIPRAGDVPPGGPLLVNGVDSIDATAVGTEILGLGHSVFATSRSILNDIALLVQGMRPPHDRLSEIRGVPGKSAPKWWRYVF
jgi:esterase/lipase superfamily enzyme